MSVLTLLYVNCLFLLTLFKIVICFPSSLFSSYHDHCFPFWRKQTRHCLLSFKNTLKFLSLSLSLSHSYFPSLLSFSFFSLDMKLSILYILIYIVFANGLDVSCCAGEVSASYISKSNIAPLFVIISKTLLLLSVERCFNKGFPRIYCLRDNFNFH